MILLRIHTIKPWQTAAQRKRILGQTYDYMKLRSAVLTL
jgi:hypothetical protein